MGKWMLAFTIVTMGAWGRDPATQAVVVVHIDNVQPADFVTVAHAKPIAARLLGKAGVQLEWGKDRAGAESVEIQMDDHAASGSPRDVLAYALPHAHGGKRIHIFSDRLQERRMAPIETVLSYVIAHEIVHVLEGYCRHSSEGVMKARWSGVDYADMVFGQLEFAPIDLEMIRAHFDKTAAAVTSSLR
jgi:hypothetical protein